MKPLLQARNCGGSQKISVALQLLHQFWKFVCGVHASKVNLEEWPGGIFLIGNRNLIQDPVLSYSKLRLNSYLEHQESSALANLLDFLIENILKEEKYLEKELKYLILTCIQILCHFEKSNFIFNYILMYGPP